MANAEHVGVALEGTRSLGAWREANPAVVLDLSGAVLRRADLARANLNQANLRGANLEWADLRWADLIGADLSGAMLSRADFHKCDLSGAQLQGADVSDTNLEDANLRNANLAGAVFFHTRLLNTDLSGVQGLSTTLHRGPSTIDFETVGKSGHLPAEFLKGCGLSDEAIRASHVHDAETLGRSLEGEGEFFSCFISYSSRDWTFLERFFSDLQARGVRCWYAPKDMRIGDRLPDAIYSGIRTQEKLLLILSEHSVTSDWVAAEVEKALEEERDRGRTVVFPIRIDDAAMLTKTAWTEQIRETRQIGDFRNWRHESGYRDALERLLDDLRRERGSVR